jgi:hypothetical protein
MSVSPMMGLGCVWKNLPMLVTCLPHIDRTHLSQTLHELHRKVSNLAGGVAGGDASAWLLAYLDWASDAARALRLLVSSDDIDRLVFTRRYELLLAAAGRLIGIDQQRLVNGLVSIEIDHRMAAFADACTAVDEQIKLWTQPGVFVVADTSVYIQHDQKLEALDFALLVPVRDEPIHVLVPIVVVDELDGLKDIKDRHVRWRAAYTLGVLDRVCGQVTGPARLRAADFSALDHGGIPRGEVTIEIVTDPPHHRRLPINDDEIVARAKSFEPLAGRAITLLTFDTNQTTRARKAGLAVQKLLTNIGPEPTK